MDEAGVGCKGLGRERRGPRDDVVLSAFPPSPPASWKRPRAFPARPYKAGGKGIESDAVEVEQRASQLAEEPFDAGDFPFAFPEAFGRKAVTIEALRSGDSDRSDLGGVLQTGTSSSRRLAPSWRRFGPSRPAPPRRGPRHASRWRPAAPYLLGERFTAADLLLRSPHAFFGEPGIRAWADRGMERPGAAHAAAFDAEHRAA